MRLIACAWPSCSDADEMKAENIELRAEVERLKAERDGYRNATESGVDSLRLCVHIEPTTTIDQACTRAANRIAALEAEVDRLKSMPVGLFCNPEALAIHAEKLAEAEKFAAGFRAAEAALKPLSNGMLRHNGD